MKKKAIVGWWFYGGSDATMTANLFGSWGLMDTLPGPVTSTLGIYTGILTNLMCSILGG